jgi:hypothetical protein
MGTGKIPFISFYFLFQFQILPMTYRNTVKPIVAAFYVVTIILIVISLWALIGSPPSLLIKLDRTEKKENAEIKEGTS